MRALQLAAFQTPPEIVEPPDPQPRPGQGPCLALEDAARAYSMMQRDELTGRAVVVP